QPGARSRGGAELHHAADSPCTLPNSFESPMPRFEFGQIEPASIVLDTQSYSSRFILDRGSNFVRVGVPEGVENRLAPDPIDLMPDGAPQFFGFSDNGDFEPNRRIQPEIERNFRESFIESDIRRRR